MPLSQFSRLISTGSALPSRCVTNDELARELASLGVETSDEWIRSRTGIETRYLVSGEEGTLSLAVGASRDDRPRDRRDDDAGRSLPGGCLQAAERARDSALRSV